MSLLIFAWVVNGTLCAYMAVKSDPLITQNKNPLALIGGILFLGYFQLIHIRVARLRYKRLARFQRYLEKQQK